jgi:hypothetical protein
VWQGEVKNITTVSGSNLSAGTAGMAGTFNIGSPGEYKFCAISRIDFATRTTEFDDLGGVNSSAECYVYKSGSQWVLRTGADTMHTSCRAVCF